MWIRLSLLPLLLGLLSLGSLWAAEEAPLTEAEVRTWAAGKPLETIVGALVTVTMNLEKLNLLYKTERVDWTHTERALRSEIENAKSSLREAGVSFDLALREEKGRTQEARRGLIVWKVVTGILVGALVWVSVR